MTKSATHILLVEDDETDVISFERACRRIGLDRPVVIARDGHQALEVLEQAAQLGTAAQHIVVTDLNMPGMSGHDFIKKLRADATLCHMIVFVLTTSDLEIDIERAYGHNVAGYIVKDESGVRVCETIEILRHMCSAIVPPSGHMMRA